jgi:hypothetical protein
MFNAILSFAAGFVVASLVVESGSVKQFREAAKEKAARLKSATQKAAAAAKEEFRSPREGDAEENA